MKLILSRKGFDSENGGYPSPVLPDGRQVSIPIPEDGSGLTYADLSLDGQMSYLDLLRQLGADRHVVKEPEVHLDPDLEPRVVPRKPDWRPVFGQCSQAQSHLDNQGVGVGDLFLFFGWFRRTEWRGGTLAYRRDCSGFHSIYAYFQVGETLKIRSESRLDWAAGHPHLVDRARPNNTLYVASDRLSLDPSLPGSGLLPLRDDRILTRRGQSRRSVWSLPACFHPDSGSTLTYHLNPERWSHEGDAAVVKSADKGQEFVTEMGEVKLEWTRRLIRDEE